MAIVTGDPITAADLNSLYSTYQNNIRSLNRAADFASTYLYTFKPLTSPGPESERQFTLVPPTDLYLKAVYFEIPNSVTTHTYGLTITGSDLIAPISLSVAGVTGTTVNATYIPWQSGGNQKFQTLFAGSRYTITVAEIDGSPPAQYVTLVVNHGYRR